MDSSSPSRSPDNSSLESSSSGGGLASAIQSELKRRANLNKQQAVVKNTLPSSSPAKPLMKHNDKHDQLIAEFRQVHRKLFASSSSSEDEEKLRNNSVEICQVSVVVPKPKTEQANWCAFVYI